MYPLISIIVPIYNVEEYIERCVFSLIEQDYSNIEIILVDDGSKDSSREKAESLANKDLRIKFIHQDNKGVSAARNTGIRNSTGSYIMFVDGDDWVEKDYVSYFFGLIKRSNCRIAMNTSHFAESSNISVKKKDLQFMNISSEKAIEWIYCDKIFVAVWNKIYDADLFFNEKLLFSEDIWYGEGMLLNIDCLQLVDQVAIGNKDVYHQTFNPDSAMRSFNLYSNYCGICSMWLQRAHCRKWNHSIELEWRYHRYRFNRTILDGIVRVESEKENLSLIKECIGFMRKDICLAIRKSPTFKQKILWICYFFFPLKMAKRNAKKINDGLKRLSKISEMNMHKHLG